MSNRQPAPSQPLKGFISLCWDLNYRVLYPPNALPRLNSWDFYFHSALSRHTAPNLSSRNLNLLLLPDNCKKTILTFFCLATLTFEILQLCSIQDKLCFLNLFFFFTCTTSFSFFHSLFSVN
ncbi:UNVERIFIED_CONTAM: hypothetical protein K2H54_060330 [Gekko kuhli]